MEMTSKALPELPSPQPSLHRYLWHASCWAYFKINSSILLGEECSRTAEPNNSVDKVHNTHPCCLDPTCLGDKLQCP